MEANEKLNVMKANEKLNVMKANEKLDEILSKIISSNNAINVLENAGIEVRDKKGKFKSLYELLHDLSNEYKNWLKEGDKQMKTVRILNLYFEKVEKSINEGIDGQIAQVIDNDPRVSKLQEKVIELNKIIMSEYTDESYPLIKLDKDLYTVPLTDKQIRDFEKQRDELQNVLVTKVHEIEVMLSACETYEQEIEVLKSYGIIDEKGKLSA